MEAKFSTAEPKAAAFLSEQNIRFSASDKFTDMCKSAFSDSQICNKMTIKKTKVSYLIQEGIAYYENVELVEILQNTKFCLLINESTDISVSQVLAIVVRFFDPKAQDVRDAFFDSVLVQDGSAQGLYDSVKHLHSYY